MSAARHRKARASTCVVPNRNTLGLLAVLTGMWYAGVTQNNGAAYLLCFVLAGVALVSILHAWANVKGIALDADAVRAAFAGEELRVTVRASSTRHRAHFGIRIRAAGGSPALVACVPASGSAEGTFTVPADRRGVFPGFEVQIESQYPLGFFTARTRVHLPARHHVYPAPRGERPLPVALTPAPSGSGGARHEGDDFAGVRVWRTGESQRHIDWKAVARGQPLVIKQWSGEAGAIVLLRWTAEDNLAPESRLSQYARWIIQAERTGQLYALQLPTVSLPPARGESHFHACLRQLAEFIPPGA